MTKQEKLDMMKTGYHTTHAVDYIYEVMCDTEKRRRFLDYCSLMQVFADGEICTLEKEQKKITTILTHMITNDLI
jgi:hypothetical protein